ncbi:MAG TPA: hypothetical protein VEC14_03495 [Reyranellaceae bacterium]|nr:hypothetical protein [Reyranellaceae bacterium]
MYSLFVDRSQKVLQVRISGVLTEQVMAEIDAGVRTFLRAEGPHRRIMDLSAVSELDVPMAMLENRARHVPVSPEVTPARAYIAPTPYLFAMCRMFTSYQAACGAPPTEVFRTFDEACAWLRIRWPDLQPVESIAA